MQKANSNIHQYSTNGIDLYHIVIIIDHCVNNMIQPSISSFSMLDFYCQIKACNMSVSYKEYAYANNNILEMLPKGPIATLHDSRLKKTSYNRYINCTSS